VTLQTVARGKAEEFVTSVADAVTKLEAQILVHKLNTEVAVGYEHSVGEILENGTQTIPFVPDPIVGFLGDLHHGSPGQSFAPSCFKSEIRSTKHGTNPKFKFPNVQN
jgi:hypothetical protein